MNTANGNIRILIDSNEVSRRFGLKKTYLRDLRHQNRIPYIKIGRLVRYDPVELEQWLRSGQSAVTKKESTS